MNTSATKKPRQESDRQGEKKWYSAFMSRPEVGPFGVMVLLFCMLGYFSIPEGQFSLNPFSGEGFNALGIRNNFRVIAQLGIVALAAGMLIIAGEFDLSVGSMIGFAGGCMAKNGVLLLLFLTYLLKEVFILKDTHYLKLKMFRHY